MIFRRACRMRTGFHGRLSSALRGLKGCGISSGRQIIFMVDELAVCVIKFILR